MITYLHMRLWGGRGGVLLRYPAPRIFGYHSKMPHRDRLTGLWQPYFQGVISPLKNVEKNEFFNLPTTTKCISAHVMIFLR